MKQSIKPVEIFLAVVSLVLAFAILMYFGATRQVMEEWDAVMHFATGRHFLETGEYIGWASHFWPPLQPVLLALGDPFVIGRLVSLMCFAVILLAAYAYFVTEGVGTTSALVATAYIGSIQSYWVMALQVENHALETAFLVIAFVLLKRYLRNPSYTVLLLCGACVAFAGLTRYTSYAAALVISLILLASLAGGRRAFVVFSVTFVALSLPWWALNFLQNGSPLHTWQYMNIGSRLYEGGAADWWWRGQEGFDSLSGVVSAYPEAFFDNWISNLRKSLDIVFGTMGSEYWIASLVYVLAICAVVLLFSKKEGSAYLKAVYPGILIASGFVALASLAFVFRAALLPASLILSLSVLSFILKVLPMSRLLMVLLLLPNGMISYQAVSDYVQSESTDSGQLTDYTEVAAALTSLGAQPETVITSVHPSRALAAGTAWVMSPLAGYSDLCEFLSFDFGPRVQAYVQRMPVSLTLRPPDFVVLDAALSRFLANAGVSFEETGACADLGLVWQVHAVTPRVSILEITALEGS